MLKVLRDAHPGIRIVLATASASVAGQLTPGSMFVSLGLEIFEGVLLPYKERRWLLTDDIRNAYTLGGNKETKGELRTLYQSYKTGGWAALGVAMLKCFTRYLKTLRVPTEAVDLNKLNRQVDVILYDVYVEGDAFLKQLDRPRRVSIGHGIDTKIYPAKSEEKLSGGFRNGRNCVSTDYLNNMVTAYVYNSHEFAAYEAAYGLNCNRMKAVGVTRHEPVWMKEVSANSPSSESIKDTDYVFLIGRPAGSGYLPKERKQVAISSIKRLFVDELGMKVVVKPHPKEKSDGIYESVFGKAGYGKTWVYTSLHPFVVGKNAMVAVSFYSGVVVDMLALNVPPIEFLDLRGIKEFDNEKSLRDCRGRPVLGYRYWGVVLGSDDYCDMREHVDDLIDDKEKKIKPLMEKYRDLYRPIKNVNEIIVNNIVHKS